MKQKEHSIPHGSNGDFTTGGTLSRNKFLQGIKIAEKGPFYTVQESMKQFEKWIKEREKK